MVKEVRKRRHQASSKYSTRQHPGNQQSDVGISGLIYEENRGVPKVFLINVICDAVTYIVFVVVIVSVTIYVSLIFSVKVSVTEIVTVLIQQHSHCHCHCSCVLLSLLSHCHYGCHLDCYPLCLCSVSVTDIITVSVSLGVTFIISVAINFIDTITFCVANCRCCLFPSLRQFIRCR